MAFHTDKSNLVDRFRAHRGLVAAGFQVEQIGRHNIKVTRGGRMLGIWRQAVGEFAWVPAGQTHPQASVLTVDDAVRHMSTALLAQ